MINFKELFHSKNEDDLLKLFTDKLNNITTEELKLFQNYLKIILKIDTPNNRKQMKNIGGAGTGTV